MKSQSIGVAVLVFSLAMGLGESVFAAGKERIDPGKREYENKCAMCHGKLGKGDSQIIDLLKAAPTDLSLLSKKNGGVFPFDRVYAVIDGREVVKGHGDRDMPIWGRDYSAETARAGEYYFDVPYDMEMYVRMRILSLIDYLNRLQSK
jgi:hypothetical protein